MMTDQEKIKKTVKFIDGWPQHIESVVNGYCGRCGAYGFDWPGGNYECKAFDPFERIEDAMVVVDKLPDVKFSLIRVNEKCWSAVMFMWPAPTISEYAETPARAIGNAALHVIEQLIQKD